MKHYKILLKLSALSLLFLGVSCVKGLLTGTGGGDYYIYSSADWYRTPHSHITYPITVEVNNSSTYIQKLSAPAQFPNCYSVQHLDRTDSIGRFGGLGNYPIAGSTYTYHAKAQSGEQWIGSFVSHSNDCGTIELTTANMVRGSVEIWCNSAKAKYPITVIVTGLDTGTIEATAPTQPACGGGTQEFYMVDTAGVYHYTAVDGNGEKWTGSFTIEPPHCSSEELTY